MLYQYELLKEYIEVWKKSKDIHGLIITGPVGVGKSFEVEQALKNEEYVMINTHVTPMKLYINLYETRNSYLIVDDVLDLFKNKDTSGLLIAATQTGTKPRILTWHTTSDKLEVPSEFVYEGKIAIICNKLPLHLEHLKSRCFYFELNLNYNEILAKLEEVCKSMKIPKKLFKFVKDNTSETTPEEILNIRLLIKLNSLYKKYPKKWQELGLYLIKQDKRLYILKKIMDKYNNVSDQIKMYQKLTGRKRSSFYKDKKRLLL